MQEAEFRARLTEAGLRQQADALIGLGLPAVRLRTVGTSGSEEQGYRVTPAPVAGLAGSVTAVASDRGGHVLAVLGDGSVAAWGDNGRGQLGDGTRADCDAAVVVRDVGTAVAVAAGGAHSLALLRDGSVVGWGDNEYAQIGGRPLTYRTAPVQVGGLEGGVRAIAAAERSSFAVLEDGSVVGWGNLDMGPRIGPHVVPVAIPGLEGGVVALAVGYWHALALMADGSVRAWGGNHSGALGDGTTVDRLEPVAVRGPGSVVAVAAGATHSLALTADGVVMAWGSNAGAALGHGRPVSSELEPVRVELDGEAVAIAAGGQSNHALLRDGSVVSWGADPQGELGVGTVANYRLTPVPVRGLPRGVRAITRGAALLANGSVQRWGGPLPRGEDEHDAIPVGASRLGGPADLPSGATWPRRDGRPMAMLAQIDLAEAAPYLDIDEPVPREGLLSLFVDPGALDAPGSWQLLFTQARVALTRLSLPPELAGEDRLSAAQVIFERETSWPTWDSAALVALGLSWPQIQAYGDAADFFEDRPIHRMLGHPTLLQLEPRDADPELCLLLQIDTDDAIAWMWGDVGCLYIWIARGDLAASRFDRAVLGVQSS